MSRPQAKTVAKLSDHTATTPSGKPVVLVIEEDIVMRVMLKLGLERHGFQVWQAASVREAIKLFHHNQQSIAVVVLDVESASALNATASDGHREFDLRTPVCFLADGPLEADPNLPPRKGPSHLFKKPFRMVDIVSVVETLANGAAAGLQPS